MKNFKLNISCPSDLSFYLIEILAHAIDTHNRGLDYGTLEKWNNALTKIVAISKVVIQRGELEDVINVEVYHGI